MPEEAVEPAEIAEKRQVLRGLYNELAAEITRAAPVCELSGRCCRFTEFGHTLFLSRVEAEVLLAGAPAPSRALDDGQTCPWQDDRGRCTARDARPLGCRVYFCDPSYQTKAEELSEKFIAILKHHCQTRGWDWNYAPLHLHLRRAWEEAQLATSGPATPAAVAMPPGGATHLDTIASSRAPSRAEAKPAEHGAHALEIVLTP
jgi:hypothetical protein